VAPPPPTPLRRVIAEKAFVAAVAFMMVCAAGLVIVSPQSFLMASPICLYGIGPVGDALFPRRGARRALARHDRRLADALAEAQRRIDLDAAWLLRADLAAIAARLPAALPRRGGRAADPALRADADRLARDIPRLEAMAAALAAARTARIDAVEALLAARARLADALAARGEAPPPPPAAPVRALREATRRRLAQPS
jgi:hypothetical protein